VNSRRRQTRRLTKSEQMAKVRSRNTGPELALRSTLWRRGFRYRLTPRLPGTPDLCFISERVAVFVDGCFWHGCPLHYTAPVRNADFWKRKLERNVARDAMVNETLTAAGWTVVRIWEHQLTSNLTEVVDQIAKLISVRKKAEPH
jgi:DNA mismatch endonuclease (patch repair protein)